MTKSNSIYQVPTYVLNDSAWLSEFLSIIQCDPIQKSVSVILSLSELQTFQCDTQMILTSIHAIFHAEGILSIDGGSFAPLVF